MSIDGQLRYIYLFGFFYTLCQAWLADDEYKLINSFNQIPSFRFLGNASFSDHFVFLAQDDNSILLGGRNKVYNLSIFDLTERVQSRIDWPSSEAHKELCLLKGKTEDDCQNYIRILFHTGPGKFLVCGTNSYKPLCRRYADLNGQYDVEKETEGVGICPYNPDHNSTAVFNNGQLYSATVADFSSGDPLIYREPQRTELSDLKQLNAPNFVSSMPYGDYIFFFYRETAVEYMNCGKIIYSRVARVCKNDKGGPHQSRDRWTSFLKARLNCSVPGEYPFYFDEIQSTSEIINGTYGDSGTKNIIYGTLTTPNNAIGGSAICVYSMDDILRSFEGNFKQQENINSNWLPVPENMVPKPRPGSCVQDTRILPDKNVNFIKTHSLMEDAVPAYFGKPILIRVSLQYRFTSIVVDPQIKTTNDERFDVIYVGTDDGKVLKVVNIPNDETTTAVVISENTVLPHNQPVKELKLGLGYGKIVVVSQNEVRLNNLNHCSNINSCGKCIELQDPHCGWDAKQRKCVSMDNVTSRRFILQDVRFGDKSKCLLSPQTDKSHNSHKQHSDKEDEIIDNRIDDKNAHYVENNDIENIDCANELDGCAVKQQSLASDAKSVQLIIFAACISALIVGFLAGFFFSRRFRSPPHYPDAPFIEQHNHLDRLTGNQAFLPARPNKTVNLVVNVPPSSPPPKKDNLDISKDINIASDGTLQKIKKTYI